MRRLSLALALSLAPTAAVTAQAGPLSRADSSLVARVLLAEDQRDTAAAALADGARSADPRIRLLAGRAAARIRDPKFAARASFATPTASPVYPEPAWRLRFRELTTKSDCTALGRALVDSAWPVRLRAADLISPACRTDSALVTRLRGWAASPPTNARRRHGEAGWQPAAHALRALAQIAPADARAMLPTFAANPVPWLRAYAARAAGALSDTATLRRLSRDDNDNVKEAAIDALSRVAGHAAEEEYLAALAAPGYQAIRAGARALKGSPRNLDVLNAALDAAFRLQRDSSETSRDTRMAVLERISEFAVDANAPNVATLSHDFDCEVAQIAGDLAAKLRGRRAEADGRCTPLPITPLPDAVGLAMGRDVRLRVTLADSSGGGSFTVRLRGDVAPLMAARVLALARAGYYTGLTWHRVEPDFVIQGGSPHANEYAGHPRFIRDELGTLSHARGTVGMSTRGHDTGDAQWFVNLRENRRLDGDYTVFGEVVDGIDVVDGVLEGDVIARIDVLPPR